MSGIVRTVSLQVESTPEARQRVEDSVRKAMNPAAVEDKALWALKRVRYLVEHYWIQGRFACRADGTSTSTLAEDAVCFCLSGAISRAIYGCDEHLDKEYEERRFVVELIEACLPGRAVGNIQIFNDLYAVCPADVVGVVDTAISRVTGKTS